MHRRTALKTALGGVVCLSANAQNAQNTTQTRSRKRANLNWKFFLGDAKGAEQASFDDSQWASVKLPHDWSILGKADPSNPSSFWGGYFPGGTGWYRLSLQTPSMSARQRLLIDFEGIYRYSQVWCNGKLLGERPNGFASFQYDLTPFLNPAGETNVIAVKAEARNEPSLRWYAGFGIYRHVWITVADQCRVDWNGTFVSTPEISGNEAAVRVVTTVINQSNAESTVNLQTRIDDPAGRLAGQASDPVVVAANSRALVTQTLRVRDPLLWSTTSPNLYVARSTLFASGAPIDEYLTTFGIRTAIFDSNRGFLLNDKPVKLNGVCIHDDLGALGTAAHDKAIERRLKILQSLGCNAIRTAHNPPAPYLLDACDRLGILVIDEAFDKWTGEWEEGDFASPGFADWWSEDLRTMVIRDRNHPSVILWSVGNEAGAPGDDAHDFIVRNLANYTRELDPTRQVTCALRPQVDVPLEDFAIAVAKSAQEMDVISVNYQEQYFDLYRSKTNKPIISSEAYPFFRGSPFQFEPINSWWDTAQRDFVAGQFVWVGFDYLGESAGWPSKGWPNGLIDTCGFVKARAAFHSTVWKPTPNVGISVISDTIDLDLGLVAWRWPKSAAHWNFGRVTGQPLLVETVTNCDTVELLVNGQSYGVKAAPTAVNWTPQWLVWFAPGTIEAIARNNGVVAARTLLRTAAAPATISLRPESTTLLADGLDLCHVEVAILDANGILVPDQDQLIEFAISGPANIIAVDNGDLRSSESFQDPRRTTSGGRALVILQSSGVAGEVILTARGRNLPAVSRTIRAN